MSDRMMHPDFVVEVNKIIGELDRHWRAKEAERAKADPKRYRLSKVMEGKHGMNYRYWSAGKDGRGRTIRYCWTMHRNVAGYFLGWREVWGKKLVTRDQWVARKAKWRLRDLQKRRADRLKAKHQPPVALDQTPVP